MLLFPVRRSGLDWCSGVEPFQRQGFEFFGPVLVCLHQTFQLSLNAQSFGLRAGADFRLEVPIDGKTHVCLPFCAFVLIVPFVFHRLPLDTR